MKWKLLSLGCLLLILGLVVSSPCQATLVWSDNFNDGNYDGWDVFGGTFSAAGLNLACGPDLWNYASYPSDVTSGEWRFDVYMNHNYGVSVYFMAQDTSGDGFLLTQNSYYLEFSPNMGYIRLYRRVSGSPSVMDSYTVTIPLGTLFEVIVTRDASGQFHVWLDGVHQLEGESTHLDASSYFIVRITESGYIDNIVVYDEIITQITTTPSTPSTTGVIPIDPVLIAAALGVVAVVIIIVVAFVVIRRRK
jgi:hypothetical protein